MNASLSSPITILKGIGLETQKKFNRLGVNTLWDMLTFFPMRLEDRRQTKKITDLRDGDTVCISAMVFTPVEEHISKGRNLKIYRATLQDDSGFIPVTFFNNKFIKNMLRQGQYYTFYGKVSAGSGRLEMISPEFEPLGREQFNKTVVPIYHSTEGLSQKTIRKSVLEGINLGINSISESLPKNILTQYGLCPLPYAIKSIHFPLDFESAEIARRRLVFEEFFILQTALRSRKILNKTSSPWDFKIADISPLLSNLPYRLTNAQNRVMGEIISDIKSGMPMNRLVQGDVGCGKTIIAAAAMFLSAINGFQAAMMAPTEILASQHYEGLSPIFEKLNIKTARLTGSATKKEKAEILSQLKSGEISIIFGTHSLLEESVEFKALALTVTDEQHRFGVRQRGVLFEKGCTPHLLAMTATPIPRSLALVMYGDLDVSVIDELPPGRQKIDTFCVDESYRMRINNFIAREVQSGHQAYIVCPAIENSAELKTVNTYAKNLSAQLPNITVGVLHGKMKPSEKDAIMQDFSENKISVLVSTTVVEVGVNVPNATMMIVENAERFGLSQLHQLRGRVGRGKDKSYCVLFLGMTNETVLERMKIMVKSNDGLEIAETDLSLRGPGEFFGNRQHGLPPLKIASLANDLQTLKESGIAAENILKTDPFLTKEENLYLKRRIEEFFKDKQDFLA